MADNLSITLVQFDIQWHKPGINRDTIDRLLTQAGSTGEGSLVTDVIVLPEMFTTGFTMATADMAEPMYGPTIRWMRDCSRHYNSIVTGTIAVKVDDNCFNRLIWMHPDGHSEHYDKRHLFRMADEHTAYTAGSKRPVFNVKGWRIRPIICYDLRFPVWCRARQNDYDALLCPANWPDPRHNAWLSLLTARAIENQAYMIANNRVGLDAHDKNYLGNSMVIDPKGQTMCDAGVAQTVVSTTLSMIEVESFRHRFPIHADADEFEFGDQTIATS